MQEIIHVALNDQLGGKVYDANKVSQWSKNIADNVKSQVKTLGYDRYKIVVEVVIGEQRGEGVRMGIKVHFLNSALLSGFTISLHFAWNPTRGREGPIFLLLV